ncbi:MAG: glycosyltransferase [Roseburia sp.]|nr:glycosyltransferase [Roseburia sp.]
MSKVPVSVCIIARDEERYIEECLRRLVRYGFEIVVTDTGSTDGTKELAAKYADKVLDFEWTDDFSAARNFCAANASNNWILALDCDEYVNNIDVPALRIFMQRFPKLAGTVRMTNMLIDKSGKTVLSVDDVIRLYNRNYYRFEHPIHEQLTAVTATAENERFLVPMEVVHQGYAISAEEMERKQKRNLGLLYKALADNPEDSYTEFQIGQSEYVLGNYDTAVEYFERALASCEMTGLAYVQIVILDLASAYMHVGRKAEALALMNKYAERYNSAKFVYMHAGVNHNNGQILKALMLYLKTVTLPDADTLGDLLTDCYANIVGIYRQMGEDEMAEMFVDELEACRAEKERILNG